jgi:hypothetical protein
MAEIIITNIALTISLQANARFLAPYFGQYLTHVSTSTLFFSISLCSILTSTILSPRSHNAFTKRPASAMALGTLLILLHPIFAFSNRKFTSELGAVTGPLASSILLFLASSFSMTSVSRFQTAQRYTNILNTTVGLISTFFLWKFERFVLQGLGILDFSCCGLFPISAVMISLAGLVQAKYSRPSLFIFTAFVILSIISPYIYAGLGILQCLGSSDSSLKNHHSKNAISVLASSESTCGFVSVVDYPTPSHGVVRLLKCDHTILGGQYVDYNSSIFANFYFMNFAKFVQGRHHTHKEKALVIGLGIGVSAKIMIENNVEVDIVEFDPVIFKYANVYFNMPIAHKTHIEDARKYLETAQTLSNKPQFDYILHDIFSDGNVQPNLFSIEAFELIKSIMSPTSVLVVNYVGTLEGIITRSLSATLVFVFKNVVLVPEIEDPSRNATLNCMFFVTNFGDELIFDNSMIMNVLANKELQVPTTYFTTLKQFQGMQKFVQPSSNRDRDKSLIITDTMNPLESEQYKSALSHYDAMSRLFKNLWTEA